MVEGKTGRVSILFCLRRGSGIITAWEPPGFAAQYPRPLVPEIVLNDVDVCDHYSRL